MKVAISLCLFVVLAILLPSPSLGQRTCVINVRQCNSNVNVCGRFGGSNLCQRFTNNCYLQTANCNSNTAYTPVNINFCNGIPVNTRRTCSGGNGFNGNNNNNNNNGFFIPGLTGGNVQPIIINRG